MAIRSALFALACLASHSQLQARRMQKAEHDSFQKEASDVEALSRLLMSFNAPAMGAQVGRSPASRAVGLRAGTPRLSLVEATTQLLADLEDIDPNNPLLTVIKVLPVFALTAISGVLINEKVKENRINDPANAERLGYTEEQVAKLKGMDLVRYENDLAEYKEEKAIAEGMGMTYEEYQEKLGKPRSADAAGFFDGPETEGATRI